MHAYILWVLLYISSVHDESLHAQFQVDSRYVGNESL